MRRPAAELVLIALLAAVPLFATLLAASVSDQRSFQVDEIEHLHSAYNMKSGRVIYRDFWEGHNPLLYVLLQPLIDVNDPVASYRRGRMLALGVLLAVAGLTAFTAHRLAGSFAAVTAAGLLSLHSTFIEHGSEVRPDGWIALAVAVCLALEVVRMPQAQRFCAQGLALSFGFLATQKTAVVTCVFGLHWLILAVRQRRATLVVAPCLVWALPVIVAALLVWSAGAWADYLRYNIVGVVRHVNRAITAAHFGPESFLLRGALRNPLFSCIAILAAAHTAAAVLRRTPGSHRLRLPLAVAFVSFLSLWLNPFPFPYVHVAVLPSIALLASVAVGSIAAGLAPSSLRAHMLVLACLIAHGLTSVPRLLGKIVAGKDDQMAMLQQINAITEPNETVFDMAGLYFRPDAYPVFVMTSAMVVRYQQGAFPRIIPYLRERAPACIIVNYRSFWLPRSERAFIVQHYVSYVGPLFVPGKSIPALGANQEQEFEVLAPRPFRFEGTGTLLVDGAPFKRGVLARGVHKLRAETAISQGLLIRDLPPPLIRRDKRLANIYPSFD